MKQIQRIFAVIGIAAVSLVSFAVAAGSAGADTGTDESAFLAKLNELRASHGVGALQVNGGLVGMARPWSANMARAGGISHNPALASQAPPEWTKLGENVGMGPDVQSLHNAFVASPEHYRNMVDPQFKQVGISVVYGSDNTIFVTVDFMSAGAPAPAPAAAPAAARARTPRSCRRVRGRMYCRASRVRRHARRR